MRSHVLLLLAFIALPLTAREFDVGPAPSWIERLDAADVDVAKENVRWGIYDILRDHQERDGWSYHRTVRKVLSPSGVQNASELTLDFDPSFEKLVIHEIALVRRGTRIDALDADDIRVIEKEEDSDERIYDGERTALIFIKDVRPGDVIDYSWSVDGANPILGGRYTDHYSLSSSVPTRLIRHRLLWNASRDLRWRGDNPAITRNGDAMTLIWQAENVKALDVEDSVPSWFEPWDTVQVSEFATWNEVAKWADAMFRLDARSTVEVKALAAKITAEHPTRDARITAAIRFVQDDVRYLGIEMGRNSHEPHQPWETLESRWGDCKDKTLLLVALLRELGLQAWPALVNTRLQHRLEERLPSPFLFDHVIAQVVEGNRTYWVDGTISEQGGTLATIETPSDGRALIVRPETTALTGVDVATKGATRIHHTYTTEGSDKPVRLEVKSTYSGGDADSMRSELSSMSLDDLAQERINSLAADQPKIEKAGALSVDDDRLRNVITITEHYRIPELWKDGYWTWYPRVLDSHLLRPETMIRSMPLSFPHPLDVQQVATFQFAKDVSVEKSTSVTDTPALRYEYDVDSNGGTITIRQRLRSVRDSIDVKDVADHLTKLNGIWSEIGYRIAAPGASKPVNRAAAMQWNTKWAVGGFIVVMFVAICVLLATRERTPPPLPHRGFRPGEAPASALSVDHVDDIDNHLAGLPCACGARAYTLPDLQRARYADREMTIATRTCVVCGKEQSVYFTAA